ncbi:sucrose-6-phosphate hydrolase [Bombilactobacillus folatiphilus]|uniref:Sucrose-6-phosphate hydrolase n=1 Tax=Bombilactobacillus folatiphilus TaxID=2923362 RepID=A0ABY4P914_9LACO|nr:sucrose-6-phosphate hydrolase [Bombilactobacillus folatiphilus]UQS82029.1 sucrose-6-phosphate hydrolase [Bombilactobacillus folatiphilus]
MTNQVTNARYRLGYHVAAPSGWINDPNGFCYFKGYYHLFYQYYPEAPEWGPMHWGHVRSRDLVHWQTLPTALVPGDREDRNGCFSGSAIVKDDTLYLIYTGNNYYDASDPNRYWQNQNLAYSQDGIHFTKYEHNPIIATPPDDSTQEFRDPKVWEHDGQYYLIAGNQTKDHLGRVLLYQSEDLKKWNYLGPLTQAQQAELEGYMWECPDLFRVNGQDILMTSPQGIEAQAQKYLNLHQSVYFPGQLNYQKAKFEQDGLAELDLGHDFYAPQTMLAPDGRRILIGWMDMWESDMPEQKDGWAGALTLPRELTWQAGQLYMQPIQETQQLRQEILLQKDYSVKDATVLCENEATTELQLKLDLMQFKDGQFHLQFVDEQTNAQTVLTYQADQQQLTVQRSDRPTDRFARVKDSDQLQLQIFVDRSSLEIFVNQGEVVFSERYYFETAPKILASSSTDTSLQVQIYRLDNQAISF